MPKSTHASCFVNMNQSTSNIRDRACGILDGDGRTDEWHVEDLHHRAYCQWW